MNYNRLRCTYVDGYNSFLIPIIRDKENGYNNKYQYAIFKRVSLLTANFSESGWRME